MLDLDFVRAQFPALETDWTLFDNAGGSVPLGRVCDLVQDYMRTCMVQLGASYGLSDEASRRVAAGSRAAGEAQKIFKKLLRTASVCQSVDCAGCA